MKRLVIFLLFIAYLSACGSGVPVKFKNQSDHKLETVRLSGSGFEASLGEIDPGESCTIKVYPSGDSALSVSFVSNGQSYRFEPQGYFEAGGMYNVTVTVSRDRSVVVDSDIGLY
jgi:hypothetical protein